MEPNQNRDPWEQRSMEEVIGTPRWTMLSPWDVVALGPGRAVGRLLSLQGTIAKGVDVVTSIPWPVIWAAGRTALTAALAFARRCLRVAPLGPSTGQQP